MSTVILGGYGSDPSTIWPDKYESCFWDANAAGWVCQTIDSLNVSTPPNETQPLGNTPDPNANPVMLPVLGANGIAGGCCGPCGGNVLSPIAGVPVLSGEVTATGKRCGDCKCGYTNREALLAVVVALAFFLLVRSK